MGVFEEAIEIIKANELHSRDKAIAHLLANALFELGEFDEALACLKDIAPKTAIMRDSRVIQFIAHLELLKDLEDRAASLLTGAAWLWPSLFRPHQNLSARSPNDYDPTELDLQSGDSGRLFDAYNFIGQRVAHVGRGDLSRDLYAGAFRSQARLRALAFPLPPKIEALLKKLGIRKDKLRILPTEWFTQIGHEGMLDILFRMRDLGWWDGQVVMLVNNELVANREFLSLFEKQGSILVSGVNIDEEDAAELSSLQRIYGMNFNAFQFSSGEVVLWQEAGAVLMRQWEAEGRGFPVRDEYDLRLEGSGLDHDANKIKKSWGMRPDDWYVCLHLRDASHYNEAPGTGQAHRNSDMKSYVSALKYITGKGGWVIKLGGPNSSNLPPMERVIDYARGPHRSEALDLHLIRHAKYFVGTTSGLTNVAVSFGVPSALVNCITTDAQLWGNKVRFAFKSVRLLEGRLITQRELTTTPWRWRTFSADVIAHSDAVFIDNTSDEILATVKEVDLLANGTPEKYALTIPGADRLLEQWRDCLGLPHFYGNATPSLYFLEKHQHEFLAKLPLPLNSTKIDSISASKSRH